MKPRTVKRRAESSWLSRHHSDHSSPLLSSLYSAPIFPEMCCYPPHSHSSPDSLHFWLTTQGWGEVGGRVGHFPGRKMRQVPGRQKMRRDTFLPPQRSHYRGLRKFGTYSLTPMIRTQRTLSNKDLIPPPPCSPHHIHS